MQFEVISGIYIGISLIIYVLVIVAMIKERANLSKTFFRIYIFFSVTNILMVLNAYLSFRLSFLQKSKNYWMAKIYTKSPQWIAVVMGWATFHLTFMQYYCILCMAFNRFTAIILSQMHSKAFNIGFDYYFWDKELYLWPENDEPFDALSFELDIFMVVIVCCTTIISSISIIGLCVKKRKVGTGKKTELNLFIVSFCNCFLMLVYVLFLGTVDFIIRTEDEANSHYNEKTGLYYDFIPIGLLDFFNEVYPYLGDWLALIDPYLIFIVNSTIRNRVFAMFGLRRGKIASKSLTSKQKQLETQQTFMRTSSY